MSWNKITIGKLQEIMELDSSFNIIERSAHITSIIEEIPIHEVMQWSMAELNKRDESFLDNIPQTRLKFKFKHKGRRFRLVKNAKEMKAHHFIELQELNKKGTIESLHEVVACLSYRVNIFGKKIEDDYDWKVEHFKSLPFTTFYNYALFFSLLYPKLLTATQIYLMEKAKEIKAMRLDG